MVNHITSIWLQFIFPPNACEKRSQAFSFCTATNSWAHNSEIITPFSTDSNSVNIPNHSPLQPVLVPFWGGLAIGTLEKQASLSAVGTLAFCSTGSISTFCDINSFQPLDQEPPHFQMRVVPINTCRTGPCIATKVKVYHKTL